MQTLLAFDTQIDRAAPRAMLRLAWAERIIERMKALYGTQFARQWESVSPDRLPQIWAEELAGFTGAEIAAGLAACKTRPWPPTLPEFMGLCRPWMDAQTAYQEAVVGMAERQNGGMGAWSHPAVYWAAARIGAYDLLNSGWQVIRNRWEITLRDTLNQKQWQTIPAPYEQLAEPGRTIPGHAEVDRFVSKIKRLTGEGAKPAASVTDCKAWARRICNAPKGKPMTVLAMAQRALQVEKTSI